MNDVSRDAAKHPLTCQIKPQIGRSNAKEIGARPWSLARSRGGITTMQNGNNKSRQTFPLQRSESAAVAVAAAACHSITHSFKKGEREKRAKKMFSRGVSNQPSSRASDTLPKERTGDREGGSEVEFPAGYGSDGSDSSTHVDRSCILTRPTRCRTRLRETMQIVAEKAGTILLMLYQPFSLLTLGYL